MNVLVPHDAGGFRIGIGVARPRVPSQGVGA